MLAMMAHTHLLCKLVAVLALLELHLLDCRLGMLLVDVVVDSCYKHSSANDVADSGWDQVLGNKIAKVVV